MSYRKWIWIWIIILLFFMAFCVWDKLGKKQTTRNKNIIIKTISKPIKKIVKPKIDKRNKSIAIDRDNNPAILNAVASFSKDLSTYSNNETLTTSEISDNANLEKNITKTISHIKNQKIVEPAKAIIKKTIVLPLGDAQHDIDNLLKQQKIEFVFSKDTFTPKSQITIDKIVTILKKYPNTNIEIGGHTDSRGSPIYNLLLSKKRAESVKTYLVKNGISEKRLKAVGYGSSKPLVKNDSLKNLKINRRVEIKVIKGKK